MFWCYCNGSGICMTSTCDNFECTNSLHSAAGSVALGDANGAFRSTALVSCDYFFRMLIDRFHSRPWVPVCRYVTTWNAHLNCCRNASFCRLAFLPSLPHASSDPLCMQFWPRRKVYWGQLLVKSSITVKQSKHAVLAVGTMTVHAARCKCLRAQGLRVQKKRALVAIRDIIEIGGAFCECTL